MRLYEISLNNNQKHTLWAFMNQVVVVTELDHSMAESPRYEHQQTDSRLFTLVAMATITELKCGKRSPSFLVL